MGVDPTNLNHKTTGYGSKGGITPDQILTQIVGAIGAGVARTVAEWAGRDGNTAAMVGTEAASKAYTEAVVAGRPKVTKAAVAPQQASSSETAVAMDDTYAAAVARRNMDDPFDTPEGRAFLASRSGRGIGEPEPITALTAAELGLLPIDNSQFLILPPLLSANEEGRFVGSGSDALTRYLAAQVSDGELSIELIIAEKLAAAQYGNQPLTRSKDFGGLSTAIPGTTLASGEPLAVNGFTTVIGNLIASDVRTGAKTLGGDIYYAFDGAKNAISYIPDNAGNYTFMGNDDNLNFRDILSGTTTNSHDQLKLLKLSAENWGVGTRQYAELGVKLYPENSEYRDLLNRSNGMRDALQSFGMTSAKGTAAMFLFPYTMAATAWAGAGTGFSVVGGSLLTDAAVQGVSNLDGSQQGWNPTQSLISVGVPIAIMGAKPAAQLLADGVENIALSGYRINGVPVIPRSVMYAVEPGAQTIHPS